MPISILELAEYRGLKTQEDGSFTMGDIEAVGLPFMGGCKSCEATIVCYNAFPAKDGYLRCSSCIGEAGWLDVAQANLDIFEGNP